LFYGMAMMAPLTVTNALVPPHPAPSAAAQMFGADLGRVILYGAALSLPMSIVAGIFYGGWIGRRIFLPVPAMGAEPAEVKGSPPPVPLVVLILLLPVILIFASTTFGGPVFGFLGHPFSALTVTVLAAMLCFGFARGMDRQAISKMATDSLEPIGTLLVIMGGGGAFKQVIVDSGVGPYGAKLLAASAISPLVVVYLMAGLMRVVQGSATVAIITAAGIAAPMVKGIPGYSPEMIVLALCCGGTLLSHVNDAGFWMVNQYLGMTVPQTLRSWTALKIIGSLVGFALVLLAQWLVGVSR
jgi:H+/gluconate symporter-like permease